MSSVADDPVDVVATAVGLAQLQAAMAVTELLAAQGISVLVLKGAPFQQEYLGNPVAYRSVDLDLLVQASDAAAAVQALTSDGWLQPGDNNAVFWRLSRALNLQKGQVVIDLHWGVHAGALPSSGFTAITDALWQDATRSSEGWLLPRPEPLFVFLAVHAAGHGHPAGKWERGLAAVADRIRDWESVDQLSRRARVRGTVDYARARAEGQPAVAPKHVFDGVAGALLDVAWWGARGHFVPRQTRDRLRQRLRG